MAEQTSPRIPYRYTFRRADGRQKQFDVQLDYDSLAVVPVPRDSYPDWTQLSYCQCPNCPLQPDAHPRCPIAVNLVDVAEFFGDALSYEPMEVTVEAAGRTYSKKTSLQDAVSSLIGIFMVSSGCPVMNKLRPMVDTHLPFMTSAESTYRVISMYLLAQYFRQRQGLAPDWSLDGLLGVLAAAKQTNAAFCQRFQAVDLRDAILGSLSVLNAQGEIASLSIETDDLRRWGRIFAEHYGEGKP